MTEAAFWVLGFILAIAIGLALIAARIVVWASIFWFAAWLFPDLEAWAVANGAHFWYGGVIVGLLTFIAVK